MNATVINCIVNAFKNKIVCCDIKTNITLSVIMHNTATKLSLIGRSGNYTAKVSGGGTVDLAGGACPLWLRHR